jgi:thiol-disulfide isomerase/thioredoxin
MSATPPVVRQKQEIGLPVADFTLPMISGEGERSLADFLSGKRGAVVLFWSSVCSHCLRYDDYLNRFAERHPEVGLVAVASRQGETRDQIRASAAERKLAFTLLHDAPGALARQWYTQQTPRAFLIDAERNLLYRGAIDNFTYPQDSGYQPYLEPAIASFLAGDPIARNETPSFGCAIQSVYYILPKPL